MKSTKSKRIPSWLPQKEIIYNYRTITLPYLTIFNDTMQNSYSEYLGVVVRSSFALFAFSSWIFLNLQNAHIWTFPKFV